MSSARCKSIVAATFMSLVVVSGVACTLGDLRDGTGSGGSGSGGFTSCLAQSISSSCSSCVQSNCGSQLSDYENGCSAYISCICPGGNYDSCAATSCQSQLTGTACTDATNAIGSCITQQCVSQCQTSGSSSGGCSSGSSGSGGSSGSSSGGETCGTPTSCGSSGKTIQACAGATCYFVVNGQTFDCTSCNDTTSCSQAAGAACQ